MAAVRVLLQRCATVSRVPLVGAAAVAPSLLKRAMATGSSDITLREAGKPNTDSWRLYFQKGGKDISAWHDVPLSSSPGTFNLITEIPRGTDAKMEIATKEALCPIKQDTKKGKLRFLTHGKVLHNYGAIPQTWEDPNTLTNDVDNLPGDNDPIDVIEIGSKVLPMGSITAVKPLGVLGLIDEDECDWKVIAIDVTDPMAKELNDIQDVFKKMPGVVEDVREWYRVYKVIDGKPENKYAFNGEAKGKAYAEKVIAECHHHWKNLRSGKMPANGLVIV